MNGFQIAFRPTAAQGDALKEIGGDVGGVAGDITALASGLCGGCESLEPLAAALRRLGTQVEHSGVRLTGLGGRLDEIRARYGQAEAQMLQELGFDAAAAPGVGGGAGGMGGRGDGEATGGILGAVGAALGWLTQEHSMSEASIAGSTLGGVLSGGASISALHYEPSFGFKTKSGKTQSLGSSSTKYNQVVGYSVGGSASLLHATADGRFGTDEIALYGEATGDVGVISASGTIGFMQTDDDIFLGVKGEAGVYAAQGKVSGGLDLNLLRIAASLEGQVGAGAKGVLGFENGVFEIGASAAFGLGGGFHFVIDINPLIDFFTSR